MASEPMRRLIARLEDEKAAADPDASWQRMREDYAAMAREFPADPAAAARACRLAGVEAVRFQGAAADRSRAVVYLHGGGYTIGGIASHEALTSRLALAAGCPLFALEYRLAPEHPFPAAVDDAVAACRALMERGIAPGRMALAGDSAGGGLAVAALLALRDGGHALPACAALLSPWTDLVGETGWAAADESIDPMVTVASLHRMAAAYMAGGDAREPLASPVFAELAGLPPLLIQVGTAEILLTDATVFAERARAAGVEVTLEVEEGAPHVWHHYLPALPEAAAAVGRIAAFVRRHGARPA